MEYLITPIWTALDLLYFYSFWNAFLEKKAPDRVRRYILITSWILLTSISLVGSNSILRQIASIVFLAMTALFLYKGPWYQHVLITILCMSFCGVMDALFTYGVSLLLGISYSEFVWKKILYTATGTTGKLFSIMIAWCLHRLRKPITHSPLQYRWVLLASVFPVISLVMALILFHGAEEQADLSFTFVLFFCILVFANIAVIHLVDLMQKSNDEVQQATLLRQQMDIQVKNIQALEKSYQFHKKSMHDYKNQLKTISALLHQNQISQAAEYADGLCEKQSALVLPVNSGHPVIDAVLNMKYQAAKELNIEVQLQVNELSDLQLPTDILVVLLSNLLDNAIEACSKLPNPGEIQCRILLKDFVYISVENTSLPVDIQGDKIPTTKVPPSAHGFGIPQIQELVRQLHGEYAFSYEDGWFTFAIEIPSKL